MAIDRIVRKIMEDAEAEAKALLAKADREAERVRAEAAKTVAEIEKKAQEAAVREADEHRRRVVSRAQADMRKELLSVKQGLIADAFQRALRAFTELKEDKFRALMEKLLLECLEDGDEEVIVAPHDNLEDWTSLLAEVNRKLSAQKRKGALVLSQERREMAGGFVLRKGKVEINCDLKLIVESMREGLEFEVARTLWGETPSSKA